MNNSPVEIYYEKQEYGIDILCQEREFTSVWPHYRASINIDNKLMVFFYSSWKDCTDSVISTRSYIVFYKGLPTDHWTHDPGPFSLSSAESEYNAVWTAAMALAHFRMLNN